MKLYTEEQVRKLLKYLTLSSPSVDGYIDRLIPIELPSDEEIRMQTQFAADGFYWGAKWMKEQILGKEDKTFKQKSKWTEVDNMTRRLK